MKNLPTLLLLFLSLPFLALAQEPVFGTFKDTRVINTHSVETLQKRKLDFRVAHRFGDVLGENGGWTTLYGLENASDILIGFEYGITDRLQVGFSRTKGSADLRQLLHGLLKFRLLEQQEAGRPLSLTLVGHSTLSTMQKQEGSDALNSFPKFIHRMIFNSELLAARKFSDLVSLQLGLAYTHRNFVKETDVNDTYSASLAARLQLTKVFGLIVDANLPLNGPQSPFTESNNLQTYYPIVGLGLEIETGGHVFLVSFTNARGLAPTDYIPNTTTNWLDGEFRLGFTISRIFNL